MSNLDKFCAELDRAAAKNWELTEKVIRKVAFDGHRNIVTSTPFDTGRAKASWMVNINETTDAVTYIVGKLSESQANEMGYENGKVLNRAKIQPGDVIHIYSNLEYMISLEFQGTSQQAPSGWVRAEAIRMEDKLQEAFNKTGKL